LLWHRSGQAVTPDSFARICAELAGLLNRLESHLDQFVATANKEEAIGRTLEFIAQEIGRELNTLSAKANDAEISQIAVYCKAELEKVREQVQNVE